MDKGISSIIFSAAAGDASGYTLNGMKKAHIKAVFKGEEGYPDPAPALKGNMDRWRKPGLYSSITQFMLITAASTDSRSFRPDIFIDAVKRAPELPDTEYSFFRDPGQAERHLITNAGRVSDEHPHPFSRSCARILPAAIPLLLVENDGKDSLLGETLKLVSLFTSDTVTAVYTYLFLEILSDFIASDEGGSILISAAESAEKTEKFIHGSQHQIFNAGYNPDYFINETGIFTSLIKKLQGVKDAEAAEKIICGSVNSRLKSPVSRGSVNLPETILPFALSLAEFTSPRSMIFHAASREGGAASALAAVSGALTTSFSGSGIPEYVREGLVNKKKISRIIEMLEEKRGRSGVIQELYETEPGLTLKEMEEYRARNKKEPVKNRPVKTRRDLESELTKHVVESWTKVDKAKWRREKGLKSSIDHEE